MADTNFANQNNITIVKERKQGVLYSISKRNNIFYIVTNADDAKNFEILTSQMNDIFKKVLEDEDPEKIPHPVS